MQSKQGSYFSLKKLPKKQFKRLVGVTFKVLKLMVKVIEGYEAEKTAGRKTKLSPEDKVVLLLSVTSLMTVNPYPFWPSLISQDVYYLTS